MHIFQNGSLVIHDVAPEDSGRYTCIAGNSCNIKHTEAPLYVVGMGSAGLSRTGSGGPDFFLILVLISPVPQKALEPVFATGAGIQRRGAGIQRGPLLGPPHSQSQVPCPDLGCYLHLPQLGCVSLWQWGVLLSLDASSQVCPRGPGWVGRG